MHRVKVVLFVALFALVAMIAGPVSALEPSEVVTPPAGTLDIAGNVTASVPPMPRPVFRLTNRYNGGVFYTDSTAVVADLDINRHDEFLYEGTAFFYDPELDTAPIYRLYNRQNGTYFYGGLADRNTALTYNPSVFVDHGVAFYVSPYSGPDKLPVLRFSVPKVAGSWWTKDCSYFLTASETERTTLLANYPCPQ